ncbi:MAG: hypothetical protein JSV85_01900 [Candidatus Bathyarchaeota archaeon]|nr:MAG: hypothetical protein JSV85_01900 [Candidatus Bathyarchaeota archaeon]
MRKILLSLFLACLLMFPLAAFNIRQAWAWDWEFIRPAETGSYFSIPVDEHIHSAETDGKASVGLGLHIGTYFDNDPIESCDGLYLQMVATGNTRKIIDYTLYTGQDYNWHDNLENQLFLGDDDCDEINTCKIRFYGGVGDAEYYSLWVSSNGALFFNGPCTDPNYSPASIPNTDGPNNFIAPFWRDLKPHQGGSITWGYVTHPGVSHYCLAVSWNGVLDANGNEQTFQVVIEPGPTYGVPNDSFNYWQSRIWFQYQSITLGVPTVVGIEDQLGEKGNSHPTGIGDIPNQSAMLLTRQGNYTVITSLTMEMIENDDYAIIEIDTDHHKGNNVYLQDPPGSPDPEPQYMLALLGGSTLLLSLVANPPAWLALGGFVLGSVLWGVDMVDALEAMAQLPSVETLDRRDNGVTNYARVFAQEPNYQSFPVDAWFGIRFSWLFSDTNTEDHVLTVRTKLNYDEYSKYGTKMGTGSVTTSRSLRVRANTAPVASNLQISPINPVTADDLVASYDYYDVDGDPEGSTEIRWYKGDVLQSAYNDLCTIPSSATAAGDVWYFTVRPHDGTEFGDSAASPSVTIVTTHDVAVADIALSKTIVGQGYNVEINVTVTNQGDFSETFGVWLSLHIWPNYVGQATLSPGEALILTYTWNTTAYDYGDYIISAYAEQVSGETDTDDNLLMDGSVLVTIPGDVDGDHDVDIFDIVAIQSAYGAHYGDPNYDPNYDINGNGDVDIYDVVIAAGNYGQSW